MRDLALAAEVTELRDRLAAEEVLYEEIDAVLEKVIAALADKRRR